MRIYAALADSGAAQGFRFRPPLSINAVRLRDPQGAKSAVFLPEGNRNRSGPDTTLLPVGAQPRPRLGGMIVAS
jgi:hypothetical protein